MPPAAARLSPSAHVDTFTRDHLPPAALWPALEFTTRTSAVPGPAQRRRRAHRRSRRDLGPAGPRCAPRTARPGPTASCGRRANQVAQVLTEDLGLVPGQRVLLRSPNNPWTVAAWLGVLKAGGVVVTTMAALRARELAPIAERTQPCVALVDHRFTEDACAVRDTVAAVPAVIAYGGDAAGRPDRPGRRQVGRVRQRGHRGRRRGAARPDVRQHRGPEDHHALPPGHPVDRRHVRPARPAAGPGRRGRLHARRSRSRSASACWSSSRCGPARARCSPSRPRPPQLADIVAERAASPCSPPRRPRTRRSCATGSSGQLAGLRTAVSRGRAHPAGAPGSGCATASG